MIPKTEQPIRRPSEVLDAERSHEYARDDRVGPADGQHARPRAENSRNLVVYIHGKGGSALESAHYVPIFSDCDVIGFDYQSKTPWEAAKEFPDYYRRVSSGYDTVYLIANSIGAFFSLCSLADQSIQKAFLISPIVNMEQLISDMLLWANVSEAELREKKEIPTSFGETLSYEYLEWVRKHPLQWNIPTKILYGSDDHMQSFETVSGFSRKCGASITVMKNGEHWFHTDEQMRFLDDWLIKENRTVPIHAV